MSGEVERIVLPVPVTNEERIRTVNAMAVLWNVALIPRDVTGIELEQVSRALRCDAMMPGPSITRSLMRLAWDEGRNAAAHDSNPYQEKSTVKPW